ncbi:MAG: rhodanese-like domain-containing protein [Herbinix sp.]|nr:rhodanese-like domain-containing protein [Herbinix sp.]
MFFDTIRANDINKYIGSPDTMIIDLRGEQEYKQGHIPTAINIPYEELENLRNNLQYGKLLIFYCERGNVSLLAARDLMKLGYSIKSLYGGIRTYRGKLERN